jgi:hypothetical protein
MSRQRCAGLQAALLGAALLAAVQPARAAPTAPAHEAARASAPRQLLRHAIDLYVVGRYADATATLRPLVEERVLTDRADQQEALRVYGIALYLTGAPVGAERAFRDLLRLDPRAALDPAFVRPAVVAFFEQVRQRLTSEQDALVRGRTPRGSALVNLLPPWGQLRNGHRGKAWALLGGEVGLAATSVVTAALLYSWRSSTGEFRGREAAYEPLSVINAASFGALAALVAYGVIDGLYYYYRGPRAPAAAGPGAAVPALPRASGAFSF